MNSSTSKTRWSKEALTVPSIEFSIGTKAASTSRRLAASRQSAIVAMARGSALAREGTDKSASSEKVPSGPKNAIELQSCAGVLMRAG